MEELQALDSVEGTRSLSEEEQGRRNQVKLDLGVGYIIRGVVLEVEV